MVYPEQLTGAIYLNQRPDVERYLEVVDQLTSDKAPAFDTSVANQARMYDYLLGGKDNYAADREAVAEGLKIWPDLTFTAQANRAFLGRAVRYLTREAGIRQFLDIGTGIPTAGNTHQIAQGIAPETRVVYVDYDRSNSGCAHAWWAGQAA